MLYRRKQSRFAAFMVNNRTESKKVDIEIAEMEHELAAIPEMEAEAKEHLADARRALKGAVVVALVGLLNQLETQVLAAQSQALRTHEDTDIDALLDVAKQVYGTAQVLESLTHDPRYRRNYDLRYLAGHSFAVREAIDLRQRPGSRQGPSQRPWESLVAMLETAA